MSEKNPKRYTVNLSFEEIKLPPFEDILIIGKSCPYGKLGISRSFDILVPDEYKLIEIDDEIIESVLINKKILKKIDEDKIIEILKENVFPFVSDSEIIKVDFKIKIIYDTIELKVKL
jgi:hypothetical protein